MEIKGTGPGNVAYTGDTSALESSRQPAQPVPGSESAAAPEAGAVRSPEMQVLAGLGQVSDLNDPEKAGALVRKALATICEPELGQLTQQEKDSLIDTMANDPLISGQTAKLMEKILRGD